MKFLQVGVNASSIAERTGQPPDRHIPEVEEAADAVESAAPAIVETVSGEVPLPS